jgi:hypothetical protein
MEKQFLFNNEGSENLDVIYITYRLRTLISTQQNPFQELVLSEVIPRLLWNLNFHYRVYRTSSRDTVLLKQFDLKSPFVVIIRSGIWRDKIHLEGEDMSDVL